MRAMTDSPDSPPMMEADPKAPPSPQWHEPAFIRLVRRIFDVGMQAISWLGVVLVAVILLTVCMRSLGFTTSKLGELQWWLFGTLFMVGLSYATLTDCHVRMDLLSNSLPNALRRCIDVMGLALLQIPLLGLLVWKGSLYFYESWRVNESSDNSGGLPWLWIPKGMVVLALALLLLVSLFHLIRLCMGYPLHQTEAAD